jgi:hypothetical protein
VNVSGYFKPWRRKIGVLTLVLSCAFVAASLHRSSETFMRIGLPVEKADSRTQDILEIGFAGFTWEEFHFPFRSGDYEQGCHSQSDVNFYRGISNSRKLHYRRYFCGFEAGENQIAPDLWFRRTYIFIPSSSVALLFSVISAYLLIGKLKTSSRPSKTSTTPQPDH